MKDSTPSRPEDHPEQHPWEGVGETEVGSIYWCPLCGALYNADNDELTLPDIAQETRP
jgi:hypothetical protein